MDNQQMLNHAYKALQTALAAFAVTFLHDLSATQNDHNVQFARILDKLGEHTGIIERHEVRIQKLEQGKRKG